MGGDVIFFLTIIVSLGTFLILLLAIAFSHRRRTQLLNAQIDFQNKMIERLGSGSELRAHAEIADDARATSGKCGSTSMPYETLQNSRCAAFCSRCEHVTLTRSVSLSFGSGY